MSQSQGEEGTSVSDSERPIGFGFLTNEASEFSEGLALDTEIATIAVNFPEIEEHIGLKNVVNQADKIVYQNVLDAKMEVVTRGVLPTLANVTEDAFHTHWRPTIEKMIDNGIAETMDMLLESIPSMIEDALEDRLKENGILMLKGLVNNTYECAMACSCPEGCPGPQSDDPE